MREEIADIAAIDVHAHHGRCEQLGLPLTTELMLADAGEVAKRARECNIQFRVALPMPANVHFQFQTICQRISERNGGRSITGIHINCGTTQLLA